MLQLLLGTAGSGKSRYILHAIQKDVRAGKKVILLIPEQFSFTAEKQLYELLGADGMMQVEVLSFTRLADRIFREYGHLAGNFIDDSVRTILMDLSMHELSDRLQVFGKQAFHLEFQQSVIELTRQFKLNSMDPMRLEKVAEELPDGALREKMRELSLIYSVYDGYIQLRYRDSDDDLAKAEELLREHHFFREYQVYIDSFSDFSAAEFDLIRHMICDSPAVYAAFTCDGLQDRENGIGLFSNVKKTVRRFLAAARECGVTVGKPLLSQNGRRFQQEALKAMEQNLFRSEHQRYEQLSGGITLQCAAGPSEEVEQAAAQICRLIREEGCRFRDIAVIVRSLEDYADLIETVFDKYELSYFFDKREDLSAKPLIRMVLAALQCVGSRFQPDDLFRLLKSDLYGMSVEEIAALENYCYIWDVKGRMWLEEFKSSPQGFGQGAPDESDREELVRLNELRLRAVTPLLHLKERTADCDGQAFAEAVFAFLEEIGARTRIEAQIGASIEQGNPREAEEHTAVWELLMSLLDWFADSLKGTRLPCKRFAQLFEILVLNTDYGRIPQTADQILIGAADKVRMDDKRAVFLLGANEEVFPLSQKRTGIFSERDCRTLIENGVQFFDSREQALSAELFYAYHAMTRARERLYVSFSRADAQGRALYPSVIVRELRGIFPALQIENADTGTLDAVVNQRTAFQWYAAHIRQDTPETVSMYCYLKKQPQLSARADKLMENLTKRPFRIEDRALSRELFGRRMFVSPSRVEKYHSCRFAYFCQNGMKARPRRKADFSPIEAGSLIHYALQVILSKHGAKGLLEVDRAALKKEIAAVLQEYLDDVLDSAQQRSARLKYLFTRLQTTVEKLLVHLAKEFAQSEFEPVAFELPISLRSKVKSMELLTPDGGSIAVEGIVDRVDVMKRGGKKYVRVVDYKSGGKSFDLYDVYYGLNLQMLIYLFSIWESVPDSVPAGVLYMPARNPLVSAERTADAKEVRLEQQKQLKMNGLLLSDADVLTGMEREVAGVFIPAKLKNDGTLDAYSSVATLAEMGKLKSYVEKLIIDMASELQNGGIQASPARKGSWTACDYCDYKTVCRHGEEDAFREICKMDRETLYQMLEKEES
ncbi:PD-(D/E)XK nuclease family protein [Candidatus Soleaferrea massiliensis]|uniref:PD-(D/E)XK nuclease family protein n=1 Tax=Candidatus Soleaferrea massiliensis TaxID=1470354 RepID=UPI00058E58D8|nr:PD-(D/E)XK nuclease family protein [Candidatus Soleaferrea massiliensis]